MSIKIEYIFPKTKKLILLEEMNKDSNFHRKKTGNIVIKLPYAKNSKISLVSQRRNGPLAPSNIFPLFVRVYRNFNIEKNENFPKSS